MGSKTRSSPAESSLCWDQAVRLGFKEWEWMFSLFLAQSQLLDLSYKFPFESHELTSLTYSKVQPWRFNKTSFSSIFLWLVALLAVRLFASFLWSWKHSSLGLWQNCQSSCSLQICPPVSASKESISNHDVPATSISAVLFLFSWELEMAFAVNTSSTKTAATEQPTSRRWSGSVEEIYTCTLWHLQMAAFTVAE